MVAEMNRVEDYMNLPYKKTLVRNQDGTYFAYVKEFQGCMTEGDNPSEAYAMLEDAMESWIEAALEDGDTVPEPEGEQCELEHLGRYAAVTEKLHRA